jgi:succinoglycan biosynthesis protein ExoO
MDPLVSIVIPAYNAAEFIGRSVASIQQQTLADVEILIVDDASTDDTAAAVNALMRADPRIRLFQQDVNGGVAVARNTGIAQARGQYIAFLDADDIFLPERIQRLVGHAEAQQLDIVTDNQLLHDAHLDTHVGILAFNPTQAPQPLTTLAFLKGSTNIPTLWEILSGSRAAYFPLVKPLIRRAFLARHALRYDPACRIGEDFDILVRCLLEGAKAAIVPQALYVYTLPYSDFSSTRSPHTRTRFNMQPVLENVDRLLRTYAGSLTPELRQALVRCRYGSEGLQQFEQFKTELYRKRPQAVLSLVTKPWLWQYVARSTTAKLRNLSTRHLA